LRFGRMRPHAVLGHFSNLCIIVRPRRISLNCGRLFSPPGG
jgi:hypothetical protein